MEASLSWNLFSSGHSGSLLNGRQHLAEFSFRSMADEDEEVTVEDGLCAELPKKYKSIRDDLKSIFQFERSVIKDEEGPAWGDGPDATQNKCSIKR